MSGTLHPPGSEGGAAPLLTPAQAQVLLDLVIFDRVVDCIDLDGIAEIERSLTLMLGDVEGVPCARARELARSILERAVRQLPDDLLGYTSLTNILSLDHCDLCADEDEDDRRVAAVGPTSTDRRRPAAHRRR